MALQKWTRRSLRQISAQLAELGHAISPPTVGRLLKGLDYALHVNAKKREAGEGHPDRNAQFDHIAQQREIFTTAGLPIINVDTKKKELIGNFKNAGRSWSREPEAVNVHDFLSEALGRAVPCGIYDIRHNRGTVVVGQSADTPEFAVAAIGRWMSTACGRIPGPPRSWSWPTRAGATAVVPASGSSNSKSSCATSAA